MFVPLLLLSASLEVNTDLVVPKEWVQTDKRKPAIGFRAAPVVFVFSKEGTFVGSTKVHGRRLYQRAAIIGHLVPSPNVLVRFERVKTKNASAFMNWFSQKGFCRKNDCSYERIRKNDNANKAKEISW